jgi:hypothetical protein
MNETTVKNKNPNVEEARAHFRAARKEMRQSMEALLPHGFLEKRRAARKEFLLGIRKLVDAAIEHVDQA